MGEAANMKKRDRKDFVAEWGWGKMVAIRFSDPLQAEKWAREAAQAARHAIAPRPGTDGRNLA